LKIKSDFQELIQGMLVVTEILGKPYALFVDRVVGQQEIVIKSLPSYLRASRGVSGCTILGDGQVSLILNLSALVAVESGSGI
jgi:two-component system chemotaxis sensor kinase CheA